MDDKRIEDMLREAWSPEPPDRLRDKVLHQPLARKTPNRWKLALAGAAVAIILFTNASDHARSNRIAAMLGGNSKESINRQNLCDLRVRYQAIFDEDVHGSKNGG